MMYRDALVEWLGVVPRRQRQLYRNHSLKLFHLRVVQINRQRHLRIKSAIFKILKWSLAVADHLGWFLTSRIYQQFGTSQPPCSLVASRGPSAFCRAHCPRLRRLRRRAVSVQTPPPLWPSGLYKMSRVKFDQNLWFFTFAQPAVFSAAFDKIGRLVISCIWKITQIESLSPYFETTNKRLTYMSAIPRRNKATSNRCHFNFTSLQKLTHAYNSVWSTLNLALHFALIMLCWQTI